ncbi:MAG: response regulator [bacterium]|nr:response regulator [bacterium]
MDKKLHVLVIDDDISILKVLKNILVSREYEVTLAMSGKEGLEKLKEEIPHLIILDIMMPEMDGYEVCRRIRKNPTLKHLPIIMLSGKGEIADEIEGWRIGIDEYLIKPFDIEELVAIIGGIIKRTYLGIDANPLTKLPGNNSIREEINQRIEQKNPFAACFIDLDNFKAFNDHCGFDKGDEAIKLTAGVIINTIHKIGVEEDFIGHIGGDDFVVITHPDRVEAICREIINEFNKMIPGLYSEEERQEGFIVSLNRKGEREEFPIMTISIGVVTNKKRNLTHLAEVSTIGSELKEYAKTFFGSNYIVDKRHEEEKEFSPQDEILKKGSILLVDDNQDICTILSMGLKNEGYRIITAQTGTDALSRIKEGLFNVVLLDIKLPDMNGLEILKAIKQDDPSIIVIIITGHGSIEVAIEALRYDAYDYLAKPLDMEKVKVTIKRGIQHQRLEAKNKELIHNLTKKNIDLNQKIEEVLMLNKSLQALYLGTMAALVSTIEAKDCYTRGHSDRVTDFAVSIAKELSLLEHEQELIRYACQLHDIGKIGIRDYILNKIEELTQEEWDEIKLHPTRGAEILKPLGFLEPGIPFIEHHHERYDGNGYPQGLTMEDIPLGARIIAVADSFDAMISDRAYRKAKSVDEAILELKQNAGKQFDPIVVEAFLKVREKF